MTAAPALSFFSTEWFLLSSECGVRAYVREYQGVRYYPADSAQDSARVHTRAMQEVVIGDSACYEVGLPGGVSEYILKGFLLLQ